MQRAVDGICLNCGHFQRFSRLSAEELRDYCQDYPDKNETSKGILEPQYKGSEILVKARIEIITKFLNRVEVDSIYIARPSCYEVIEFMSKYNCSSLVYRENNAFIDRKIQQVVGSLEHIQKANYKVHGELELKEHFDAYIIIHCLQHVLEAKHAINKLCKLAKKGKSILLMEEVSRKLHNPFHVNHFSERFLSKTFQSMGLHAKVISSSMLESSYQIGLQTSDFISGIHIYV